MVISQHIQKDFESLAKNEDEKSRIVRVYNPLDTEEILQKAGREKQEVSNAVPVFVSVGTVFPQKGFDRLLKVHQKLLEEGFNHQLKIVGDGYDFENIKKLKSDLGVVDTADMTGFTDNPYPHFRNADFFVLSSRYEGFPTVLFEAITLKKKIIATEVSGVSEMLENGKLGLIVENSEQGIYDGMKKALENPESFDKYLENMKGYQMPFTLEKSVQHIQKIIDNL
ncbi:glycosyltransferase [Sphingobacterium lactis]|nr:glycosyltransferase [Lactococcus lactis]